MTGLPAVILVRKNNLSNVDRKNMYSIMLIYGYKDKRKLF